MHQRSQTNYVQQDLEAPRPLTKYKSAGHRIENEHAIYATMGNVATPIKYS